MKLKIKSTKSLGVRKVYDLSVPEGQNFVLEGGVVAHNCKAHAFSYSVIAYSCAWLKHHYPLEWWCAVLRNASKDKIANVFWRHCKDFVDPPDISVSGANFEIHNGRVKSPLGFLTGVGPKVQEEISKGMPYKSADDFCEKIVATKKAGATTDPETGKVKLGKTSIHTGILEKLVVTGVLDSLFAPEHVTPLDKMTYLLRKLSELEGKKRPAPVSKEFLDMSPMQVYLARKSVLPIYGQDLRPLLASSNPEKVAKGADDDYTVWSVEFEENVRLIGIDEYESIRLGFETGRLTTGLLGNINVAVVAYVSEERRFGWKDKKTGAQKEGMALQVDVEGQPLEFVRWPDRSGKQSPVYWRGNEHKAPLKGSVCILTLSKYEDRKPFQIENITPMWIEESNDNVREG